jgi:HSP20 family molecular chaperone IbpA
VEKTDIKLQTRGRFILLGAQNMDRKYATEIHVPDYVESKPKKAEYKNGVLELTYLKDESPTDFYIN